MDRVDAVALHFEEYRNNSYLTHNYHPYPAKFIPQIPAELIRKLSKTGDWILDPYCGSGTTLVEAKIAGRNSVGIDINTLSCMISRAKTKILSEYQATDVRKLVVEAVNDLNAAEAVTIPKFYGIEKWFAPKIQQDLARLLTTIRRTNDVAIREFLEVAFSAIVVKVSRQESDTRYKAVDKDISEFAVGEFFAQRVGDMLTRMQQFRELASPCEVEVYEQDSTRTIPGERTYDLAITSPPYMNSYDYYLYHKHRMNWLGLDHRSIQEAEFGSRNKHNDLKMGLDAYNNPIERNARLVYERLRKGGHYCLVVGDAILRGDLIKMNKNFDEILCRTGFRKIREISFPQRKYTRAFTPKLRIRHKDSYVLIYQK